MARIETLLAKTGCIPEEPTGDLVSPLHLATTYERAKDGSYPGGYMYTRNGNPTRSQFEQAMARLEGGEDAAAFSSGMAAADAVFQALDPGDHVIVPDDVYYGVRRLLADHMARWGLEYTEADFTDPRTVKSAVRKETRLVWVETPSNPLSRITDIQAIADVAHAAGAIVVVDGTWTTPVLQRPLSLGADLVHHSVTKYLAGHSDVLGGVLVTRFEDPFWMHVRQVQSSAGAVMDPFSAWLAMRGMRSLAARMPIHCRNAREIAHWLAGHPRVTAVHYAGLPDHPGNAVATRQMSDFGGMLSFQVKGGRNAAFEVAARVKVFTRATSLGGTESLIEHRASTERQPSPTPEDLLRLSVGLEHIDDLMADLEQALSV